MRYTHNINASRCIEWGLNLNQGALVDIINQASSWADVSQINGITYYWVSRNKVISEIPLAYSKPDTVYRALKTLAEKGIIEHIKDGKKDLVRLTEKGKSWNVAGTTQGDSKLGNKSELGQNSEINPTKLGNKSENNSEINPTYNNTINNNNTKDTNTKKTKKKEVEPKAKYQPKKPNEVSEQTWNDLLRLRKTKRAVESQTAWTRINNAVSEAQKATGHSLEDIYSYWVSKSWTGFDASWYLKAHPVSQQTNYQGNTHANGQSVNHSNQQQPSQQFDTSTSSGYAAKLDADAAAYFASIDTQRAVNPSYQEFVSEVEGVVQREDENTW